MSSQIAAYYHTHWDREWYQSFREYQIRLAQVVDTVLERLESGELPCFMLDGQTVVLEDYLELRPYNRERLERLIRSGQLTIGPWYVAPDEFLVSGESLIRNLQRGIAMSRAWGCDTFTGYLPDNFGHSADIPMLLRQFGIDSAVVWRGVNPERSEFYWEGPTGDRVLAYHLTDGYMQNLLIDPELTASQRQEALQGLLVKIEQASALKTALVPVGGDHLGPAGATGRAVLRETVAGVSETTPERFMQELRQRLNGQALPIVTGELRDNQAAFLLPGVYSSRLYLKQANRRLEHCLTHQLEPLLALTQALPGAPRYPAEELDLAWKTLLLNHPHDSICGCSVDVVHRENEGRFEQVETIASVLMRQTLHHLNGQMADENHWVVYNCSDQPFSGVVPVVESTVQPDGLASLVQAQARETVLEDSYLYDINELPLSHKTMTQRQGWLEVEDVPPHGFKVFPRERLSAILPDGAKPDPSSDTLQNEFYRIRITETGLLAVEDLKTGVTLTGFLRFQDRADQGDSYNSAPVPGTEPEEARFLGGRLLESGPYVGTLELRHELAGMELKTRVQLKKGSRCVEFETSFINQKPDHKVQVLFDTGRPVSEVWAESHFGLVQRRYDPTYDETQAMPAERMRELPTNTGPVQRFFGANGHGWITEGLAEYEVRGEAMAITLLRAFSHLSKGDTGVRGAQAGPPFATPEGQCLGRSIQGRYAWLPVPDVQTMLPELYQEAAKFYGCARGFQGCADSHLPLVFAEWSLVRWENPQVVSSAMHWWPEPDGLVLRLLNTCPTEQTVRLETGFTCAGIQELDLSLRPLDRDVKIEGNGPVQLAPHAVKTLLLKRTKG